MTKSFGKCEKDIIKQKLQESCEKCWGQYGYKKTGIAELCKMVGISTGAFYLFYSSKEMLFMDTFDKVEKRFNTLMDQITPQNPTKYDFGVVLKRLFHELIKTPWVLKLQDEFEILVRKLPREFIKKHYNNDLIDFNLMIDKYKLKPKVSVDEFTSMSYILAFSILNKTIIGDNYDEALDLIIDGIIEKYFD